MTDSDIFYGWKLLFELIENEIEKDADIIIAIAHWQLVTTRKLSCLGIGDDVIIQVLVQVIQQ